MAKPVPNTPDLGAAWDRPKIEEAFALIWQVASHSASEADATKVLAAGGLVAMPPEKYVEAFLQNVNDNLRGELLPALVFKGLRSAATRYGSGELDMLVTILERTISDRRSVVRDWGEQWRRAVAPRVLGVPRSGDALQYDALVLDGETASTMALRILASPEYEGRLRRCELESCRVFFLRRADQTGAPRKFCEEHSEEAYRLRTRERVRKLRADRAARKARSHK